MSDSVDKIVQMVQNNANDSKKSFLQDVDELVKAAIAQNIDNEKFQNAVDSLKDKTEELNQLKDIPDIRKISEETAQIIKEIKASEEQTTSDLQFVKNTLKPEDVTDIKAKMNGISNKNDSILEGVQKLESTLTPNDVTEIKTDLHTMDKEIKELSASAVGVVTGIKTLNDAIKAEDIQGILTRLNDLNGYSKSALEIIKDLQFSIVSNNENSIKSSIDRLQNTDNEEFSKVHLSLEEVIRLITELNQRQNENDDIEDLKKRIDEKFIDVEKIQNDNKAKLDTVMAKVQLIFWGNMIMIVGIIALFIAKFI